MNHVYLFIAVKSSSTPFFTSDRLVIFCLHWGHMTDWKHENMQMVWQASFQRRQLCRTTLDTRNKSSQNRLPFCFVLFVFNSVNLQGRTKQTRSEWELYTCCVVCGNIGWIHWLGVEPYAGWSLRRQHNLFNASEHLFEFTLGSDFLKLTGDCLSMQAHLKWTGRSTWSFH